MVRQAVLVWALIVFSIANCKAFETIDSDFSKTNVASLVLSLNSDLASLGRSLFSNQQQLAEMTVDVQNIKDTSCSTDSSVGTTNCDINLRQMEELMEDEVKNAIAEKTAALEQAERAIQTQRSALAAIEDALLDLPDTENRILDIIRSFEFLNPEPMPEPSAQVSSRPKNCLEAKNAGGVTGVTTIYPGGEERRVRCDQDTNGGGWTVLILRQRQDPQLDFHRNLNDYTQGFGEPSGEHWLGLKALYEMTKDEPAELMVTMAIGDERAASYYDEFSVDDGSLYNLHVSGYDAAKSTGGDSLSYHDGHSFTTYDRDRDGAWGGNCEIWSGGGGFWYNHCFLTNPTGLHPEDKQHEHSDHFLEWRRWQGSYGYLSDLVMMIRPRSH